MADLRVALMIRLNKDDLCTTQIGQSGGCTKRHRLKFGISPIDDFCPEFNRVFGRLTGTRGIAGERINDANLDVSRMSLNANGRRHEQGRCDPARFRHLILPVFSSVAPHSQSSTHREPSDQQDPERKSARQFCPRTDSEIDFLHLPVALHFGRFAFDCHTPCLQDVGIVGYSERKWN